MKVSKNITPGPMDPQRDEEPPGWVGILLFALAMFAIVLVVFVCTNVHGAAAS